MPDRRRPASRWPVIAAVAVVTLTACGNPGSAAGSGTTSTSPTAGATQASPGPSAPASTALAVPPSIPDDRSTTSSADESRTAAVTTVAAPPPSSTTAVAIPDTPTAGFAATVAPIDDVLRQRMTTSWRTGCPVPLSDLRHLTLTYRGFDGADHTGELVVAAAVADDVVTVFRRLHDLGYPIASMRLVDDFGGDDDASMAADNTSAFNCRAVTGGGGFSEHSYGTAIDVNPVENPYVRDDTVLPAAGVAFLERPDRPGVLHDGDAVVAAFAEIGWSWGGAWSSPTDYQHFSLSGR